MSSILEERGEISQAALELRQRVTIPDRVARALRDWIFGGRLQPGERILEGRLAQQLDVAQATVREALKTLESEGLVIRQPHRGCSVTKFSAAQWDQAFSLRVELEMLAADWACQNRKR